MVVYSEDQLTIQAEKKQKLSSLAITFKKCGLH